MIRTAYPTPPVRQLRLNLESVTRRARRALSERCRAVRLSSASEMVEKDSYADYLRRRETVQQMRATYDAFEKQFDGLVSVVCFAAQEGLTPEAETDFSEYRSWFMEHYKNVRPYLAPHETSDESDVIPTQRGMKPCDTFEALFLPPSVKTMLEWDNGCLINRLMRAQDAAMGWYTKLRDEEKGCL